MKIVDKIIGTYSEREIKRIRPLVDKIESLRPRMQALSDEELRNKTAEYRKRLEEGETLDDLLPEAYATVREATARVLKTEHYKVQLIGGIIMVHGDNEGLVLPPRVAPVQVCIVPIQQKKEGVLDKAYELRDRLKGNFRVKVDDTDKSPGWKFAEAEMRGYPVRIEIGPKDMEAGKCVLCRRDTREKIEVTLEELEAKVGELLDRIQKEMLERARDHRDKNTYTAADMEEFEKIFAEKSGFVKAMWCGDEACENVIKEKLSVTSRCMPFEQEHIADTCVCCGKPAKKMVYWGRAY